MAIMVYELVYLTSRKILNSQFVFVTDEATEVPIHRTDK
jgi:hypothetical protein